jgi:DNA-directed RNA polymerase specialized sigma24 family protein
MIPACAAHLHRALTGKLSTLAGRRNSAARAVLMLRDIEGIDEHTVALLLGIPVGTVKSRLSRPRDRFRKEWAR